MRSYFNIPTDQHLFLSLNKHNEDRVAGIKNQDDVFQTNRAKITLEQYADFAIKLNPQMVVAPSESAAGVTGRKRKRRA